jgi:homoserine dehydrogenase
MGSKRESIGIGLMGLGTVGSGVARILHEKAAVYARQIGCALDVRRVLVRNVDAPRAFDVPRSLLTTDAADLLDDPGIDMIIETIGGEEPAHGYLRAALARGKFVVTANKEVMAKHGGDLLRLARANSVDLLYEASVGGGIPIIAPLKRDLLANDIMGVTAIINGTTNYILTSMSRGGASFAEALAAAQKLGYAEPDPTNDIEGHDAAFKLSILATLAFHADIHPDQVYREGITRLSPRDFEHARDLGYAIKLIAAARKDGDAIEVRVHPALVPRDQLLASVDGVLNAVEIEGDLLGRVLFQGPGAGSLPTASAVVADALDAAVSISNGVYWPHSFRREDHLRVRPIGEVRSRFFIRLHVADEPGVLAAIAGALGARKISIASVIQREGDTGGGAEVVIMTHDAVESDLRAALADAAKAEQVRGVEQVLRVRA